MHSNTIIIVVVIVVVLAIIIGIAAFLLSRQKTITVDSNNNRIDLAIFYPNSGGWAAFGGSTIPPKSYTPQDLASAAQTAVNNMTNLSGGAPLAKGWQVSYDASSQKFTLTAPTGWGFANISAWAQRPANAGSGLVALGLNELPSPAAGGWQTSFTGNAVT